MPIPFSFIKSSSSYDPDAELYINAVGDLPNYAKTAINNWVVYLKTNNLWSELHWMFMALPSMTTNHVLRNLKNSTIAAGASLNGTSGRIPNIAPSGVVFNSAHAQYINPDVNFGSTTNSTVVGWKQQINKPQGTEYVLGASGAVSASNAGLYQERNASNNMTCRVFGATTGQNVVTNTNTKGDIISNRNASNYLETVKDGVILGTPQTGAQTGTIPTEKPFWGALNTTGTPSLYGYGTYPYVFNMNGLSLANRALLATGLANLANDMKWNFTKQIIVDGNSLTALDGAGNIGYRMFRRMNYVLAQNNVVWLSSCLGVGGQMTTAMSSDFSTDVIPKFNSGASLKVYIPIELTNDYSNNGNVTTAINNYWALCDLAKAQGYYVIAVPMAARSYLNQGTNPSPQSETDYNLGMDAINQAIAANWSLHADQLFDDILLDPRQWVSRSSYASDALFNTAISGIVNNPLYFTDGTHNTDTIYDYRGVGLANRLLLL